MKTATAHKPVQKWSPENREEFILEYLPIVRGIAQRIWQRLPSHLDLEDLVSAGIMGLLDAMDKYDPARNTRFRTYAEFRIRGAILDELRAKDWLPRSIREKINHLLTAVKNLEQELGRTPTTEEIANELGISIEQANWWVAKYANMSLVSLEELINPYEAKVKEEDIEDWLASPISSNPFEALLAKELREIVLEELEKLPENEKQVLSLYYLENLNLKEIGEIMGVTESRVSQIHTQARLRLKKRISSRLNKGSPEAKVIPFSKVKEIKRKKAKNKK